MLWFRTNCFRVTRKIFLVAHFQQGLLGLLHFFFGTADYNLKEVMVCYKSILQHFLQVNSNLIKSTIGGRKFDLDPHSPPVTKLLRIIQCEKIEPKKLIKRARNVVSSPEKIGNKHEQKIVYHTPLFHTCY
jgi:hypothetical protein